MTRLVCPTLFAAYFRPDYRFFSFFPWASFLAFGVSAGTILRLVGKHTNYDTAFMHRTMQWSALLGFGLIMSAQYFSSVPYSLYSKSEFWLDSPGLILIKLGAIMVIIPVTFLWTHHGAGEGWSWVRQLGTSSLLVYWVHIELVYGRWFWFWKEKLTIEQCAAVAARTHPADDRAIRRVVARQVARSARPPADGGCRGGRRLASGLRAGDCVTGRHERRDDAALLIDVVALVNRKTVAKVQFGGRKRQAAPGAVDIPGLVPFADCRHAVGETRHGIELRRDDAACPGCRSLRSARGRSRWPASASSRTMRLRSV